MVYQTGLLSQGPECPNQHGPMEQQSGAWAIDQVLQTTNLGWNPTGTFFLVSLYRCKTCGLVQLYDKGNSYA